MGTRPPPGGSDVTTASARGIAVVDLPETAGAWGGAPIEGLRPDFFPGYRLLSVLGRGGMGVVYKAVQIRLDRTVALKVLHAPLGGDDTLLRRFRREALTAARLCHPNIIQAFDTGETGGLSWLALELVDGINAHDAVARDGPMPEREALRIVRDAARGLAHAHAQGVIHRDVKPSNILLARPSGGGAGAGASVTKVADLGLARPATDGLASELTASGHLLGTPTYMAPEQAQSADVDHRADIYALGATLYYLLTGVVPFRAPSLAGIVDRKLHGTVEHPRDLAGGLSDSVVRLLDRMMARPPGLRPASYEELLHVLDALLAGAACEVPAPVPGPASSIGPRRRMAETTRSRRPPAGNRRRAGGGAARRATAWIAGAAAVLLAGGLMAWLLSDPDRPPAEPGSGPPAVEAPARTGPAAASGETPARDAAGPAAPDPEESRRRVREVLGRKRTGIPPARVESLYRDLESLPADALAASLDLIQAQLAEIEGGGPLPGALRVRARDRFREFSRRALRLSEPAVFARFRSLETDGKAPELRAGVDAVLEAYREAGIDPPAAYAEIAKRIPGSGP